MSTVPSSHKPKFVRRFADVQSIRRDAVAAYAKAVRDRTFPHEVEESYKMDKSVWEQFLERRRMEAENSKQRS
jgi:ketopantoate hydroxymethyltransferase